MSTEQKPARGASKDGLAEIVSAQNRNGSIQITIPKSAVDRFGIEKGDGLLVTADEDAEELVYKHYYNIGIATHTDAGLMVPVVKHVGEKGALQIASEIAELSQKARDRSISREEMQDGTFTITNYGAIGGEFGTPIINHPEVAIMGVGRIEERPVVEDGEVVAKPTLPLSIGIDHRVVDGGTEAAFKNRLKAFLREPERLLLE
jgi:pyruvate dehydrogenase E2 component (dihydrolipoamide acetyltransferase)